MGTGREGGERWVRHSREGVTRLKQTEQTNKQRKKEGDGNGAAMNQQPHRNYNVQQLPQSSVCQNSSEKSAY